MNLTNPISVSAALLLICGTAFAEPAVDGQTRYYHIKGESARELRHSMNREKPKSLPHDAFTHWNVTWTYAWRNVEGGVILQNPKVSVSISTTLPRWTPPKDTSPELIERWRSYMRALVLHENSHGAIARQAGRDIERQLLALPRQPSADALKQVVESIGQQTLKEARDKENRFDEQTQHGMKQGARFP